MPRVGLYAFQHLHTSQARLHTLQLLQYIVYYTTYVGCTTSPRITLQTVVVRDCGTLAMPSSVVVSVTL